MAKAKISGAEQVKQFLDELKHSHKKEVETIRKIILAANKNLTEQIKWNAPSFCNNGDDRITMNLSGKGMIRLIFHRGAKVKDSKAKGRILEDKTGLLEWAADDRAVLTFKDMDEVKANEKNLVWLVQKWIEVAP
jgi:hypothetical protein